MNIAKLSERIMVQKVSTVIDDNANHRAAWTDYYSCAAYVYTYQQSERNTAGLTIPYGTTEFTVRYCSELAGMTSNKYRIVFRGRNYDIESVDFMNYGFESIKIVATIENRETGAETEPEGDDG